MSTHFDSVNVCLDENAKISAGGIGLDSMNLKYLTDLNLATFIHFMTPFGLVFLVLFCGLGI